MFKKRRFFKRLKYTYELHEMLYNYNHLPNDMYHS